MNTTSFQSTSRPFFATVAVMAAQVDRCTVNGEVRQSTSTGDMIWSVAQLVAYLSIFLELQPGDVICTGTTKGVASMRTPPAWLKPGDRVQVEISGIGTLSNPVVAEK